MKIALCFSGQMRDLNDTKNFWLDLINRHNIDVYASFWDIENIELGDTIQNFIDVYNPKKIEVENYQIFKRTTQDLASIQIQSPNDLQQQFQDTSKAFGQLPMWYKIWRCNMLRHQEDYDFVIRARVDTLLDTNFELQFNEMLNVPMGVNQSIWHGSVGINDCFAYGPSKVMDWYSFLYQHMMDYLNRGHYLFPPEHFLAVHMSKIHCEIRYFPSYMIITRTSKGTPNEVYNNFVNPPFESQRWSDTFEFVPVPEGNFKKEDFKEDFDKL
jgi:hypothetical protein